jgi:hypothetical protein
MTIIDEIKNLISVLPENDVPLALKFIENRQFEHLKDLVDSDVIKLNKTALQYEHDTSDYFVALSNLDNCLQLQQNVNKYLDQLGIYDEYIDVDEYDLPEDDYDEDEYYDHLWYLYMLDKI